MGFWGIVFSIFFLPTIALCFASNGYRILGVIMLCNWLAYILPFRSMLDLGDGPFYFVFVSTLTAVLLVLFASELVVARVIIGAISILIIAGYLPYYLNLINLHQTMVIADIIGYIQILAMIGGAGGNLARNSFGRGNSGRRGSLVVHNKI